MVTDALGQVFEQSREDDNRGLSLAPLALVHPDLAPAAPVAPTAAASADTIAVSWTVANVGSGAVTGNWVDRVLLSVDATPSPNDRLLAERPRQGPLPAGASYSESGDVVIPVDVTGSWFVLVATDAADTVRELFAENNNTGASAIAIALAPYADLVTSAVVAPERTVDDPARVVIEWTVANAGPGRGITDAWVDSIIASRDGVLGGLDDVLIAQVPHAGGLDGGASYTREESVLLPRAFTGRFTLFVRADSGDAVFENGLEANNAAGSPQPFDVMPIPYADLVIESLVVPPVASSGQPLSVTWTVRNQGIGTTNVAHWYDRVYLATNPDGTGRTLLGTFDHIGFLAPGGTYPRSASITLAEGLQGTFYVVVETPGRPPRARTSAGRSSSSTPATTARCRRRRSSSSPTHRTWWSRKSKRRPGARRLGDRRHLDGGEPGPGRSPNGTWIDRVYPPPVRRYRRRAR